MAIFPEVGFGKITEEVPAAILRPFSKFPERMAVVVGDAKIKLEKYFPYSTLMNLDKKVLLLHSALRK